MSAPMIAKVMPAAKIRRNASTLSRYIWRGSIMTRSDALFGTIRHVAALLLVLTIQALCAFHESSRACEARHVMLSATRGLPRRKAIKQLFDVFNDWRRTYAPDRAWFAGIHLKDGNYHLHAAIANVGADGQPLKFRPYHVKAMAAMSFTEHATSAKGLGKTKSLPVYPYCTKLAVRDLAELVVGSAGAIKKDVWNALATKGALSEFRCRKDGSLISFLFGGKRIRITTLERFALRMAADGEGGAATPSAPAPFTAVPESIATTLLAAGFTTGDLAGLNAHLKSLDVTQQKAAQPSSNHTTPTR